MSEVSAARASDVLLCRVGECVCALPLERIIETLRPLPVEALPDLPDFVAGVSLLRGRPTPVLDLARLFAPGAARAWGRFVAIRAGQRRSILAVQSVIGVTMLGRDVARELPPLLRAADTRQLAALGARDGELLKLLDTAQLVPQAVWSTLQAARGAG